MLDPCHALTCENLQLGEGVLLRVTDADALLSADAPAVALAAALQDASGRLGVTKAGMVFRCVPSLLDTTSGHRTPALGETLVRRWEATLSGTLLEITPANAALLLGQALPKTVADLTPLTPAASPEAASPADLIWVGDMGDGLLAIALRCPVSTGGMIFRARRDGLGEMDFTLLAHHRTPEETSLPCRLLWLKEADA